MMKASYTGPKEAYEDLKPNSKYDVDFRNEGNAIFVEVNTLRGDHLGTYVFKGLQEFLDSFRFDKVTNPSQRVRRFTDFDHTKYFSSGEVAEYFGITVPTVAKWAKQGRLRVHHTIGARGDKRFAREDVQALYGALRAGFD